MATSVTLVRHGETAWSLSGQHTGRTDIPLTEHGREEAAEIGRALAGFEFDLVLTSPLQRAIETCALASLGASAEVDPDLREWDYGDYEGVTTASIHETRPDWNLFRDGVPGGEDAAAIGVRVDRVLERARACEGKVAFFAHGHVLRVLGARWVGLPPRDAALFGLTTGTVSVLGFERATPIIASWNLDPTPSR